MTLPPAHRLCRHAGVRGAGARRAARRRARDRGRLHAARPPGGARPRASRTGPVKRRALELGIRVEQPRDAARGRGGRASSRRTAPDLLVVVAYGLILPQAVLDAAAARLPQHPRVAAAALARRRADPARDPRGRRAHRRHHHEDGRGSRHRAVLLERATAIGARRNRAASCTTGSRSSAAQAVVDAIDGVDGGPHRAASPSQTQGVDLRGEDPQGRSRDRLVATRRLDRTAGARLQSLAGRRDALARPSNCASGGAGAGRGPDASRRPRRAP